MLKAAGFSETFSYCYQTTRPQIPDVSGLISNFFYMDLCFVTPYSCQSDRLAALSQGCVCLDPVRRYTYDK